MPEHQMDALNAVAVRLGYWKTPRADAQPREGEAALGGRRR
jgi:hypothetical protein